MLEPEERQVYACRTCRDVGLVADGRMERECPDCVTWDEDRRESAYVAELARRGEKPELTMADLTAEERPLVVEWRRLYPKTNLLTFLLWIEGRRYEPREDPEFLALVERRLAKWRFNAPAACQGMTPGRLRHALETGETGHLTEGEMELYQALREERRAA